MAEKNTPGYYPVVSMTDGVVTEKGWLEKDWPGKDGPGKDWRYGDESIAYEISCRLAERVYKKGKALEKRR